MKNTEFPTIKTQNLFLNKPLEKDLEKIVLILNNEIYSKNTLNIPFPYQLENAKFFMDLVEKGFENKNQYTFAIRLQENGDIIGAIGLHIDVRFNKAEIGYWLDENFWNKGYATEATKAIIKFGFEKLNLKRIFASVFDFNNSSEKVLQNSGMKKEGVLECHTCKNGEYQNHILYAIINR